MSQEDKREDNIHVLKPEDVKADDHDALGKLLIANSTQYLRPVEEVHMPVSVASIDAIRKELKSLDHELKVIANEKQKTASQMREIDPTTFVNPYLTIGDCQRYILGANYKGERLEEYIGLAKQLEKLEVDHQIKDKRKTYLLGEISYQCTQMGVSILPKGTSARHFRLICT